jgi:hypothetical protein
MGKDAVIVRYLLFPGHNLPVTPDRDELSWAN